MYYEMIIIMIWDQPAELPQRQLLCKVLTEVLLECAMNPGYHNIQLLTFCSAVLPCTYFFQLNHAMYHHSQYKVYILVSIREREINYMGAH